MGNYDTQEPGHDFRQAFARSEPRDVRSWPTLCGTQPCTYTGRSLSLKNIIPQYAHTSREVLTYASEYNNEQQIDNEIESGKAVYSALQQNDYDEAAKQYLMLVTKKAENGDFKEAMQQANVSWTY